jgi:molecular chaperone DnaK (HSP70)
VKRAVVTVPAYFDDPQRQATRDAGRIAGLEVVRVLHEPTAAALAYGIGTRADQETVPSNATRPIGETSQYEAKETAGANSSRSVADDSLIAVFDFGGGTFDVSILRLHRDIFEVIATKGDTHLGGDDLDRCIIQLVRQEAADRYGADMDNPATRQALRLLAESVKMELSKSPSARIELDLGGGRRIERALSRDEFEAMIAPLVDRTLECCRLALRDAKVASDRIGQVVLVGGSTRIPFVRRRVREFFGRVPYTALNPDEVVALGAAVQGQILAGARDDALLLDVTPLSLGIETLGGAMGKLIMRNTRIPCQATEAFTTFVDGQSSVKINVLQGERELAQDCRSLAEFDLQGIPPMPAGIPKIEVQFLLDANGILQVSARELRSGQEASIQVLPAHGLTREEVRRIEEASVRFAREDLSAHRLIDLRNQIEFDTHKTEVTLAQFGHLLEPQERRALEEGIRVLRDLSKKTGDAEKLHRALDAFGKSTEALANLAITESLRESPRSDANRSSVSTSGRS